MSMDRTRRAFLAAVGTTAIGGCTESQNGSNVTETSSAFYTHTSTHTQSKTRERTTSNQGNHDTKIGFVGDTMVGRTLNHIYGKEEVDPASIWGDFQPQLESLDGVLCNLECCLSKRGERFPNRTYYFRGDPEWAIPALKAGNIQFANLANNHTMDFGAVALTDTIDALESVGIASAGAGKTSKNAYAPATFSIGEVDIAVISFSFEYKEYAATNNNPGIAWVKTDVENSRTRHVVGNSIKHAQSENPDLLIVSVHWGENWIERPNDKLVKFGHWLVDQGVDLVHGHSAHVVQAIEQYGDGIIFHDTGDLVDDFGIKGNLGNDNSYLFEVKLKGDRFEDIRLVPFHIDSGVIRASEGEAIWLRKTLRERSEPFTTTYNQDGRNIVVPL